MSRAARIAWWRAGVIVGAVLLLELLCRAEIISRLVLLPPSDMAATLWELLLAGEVNQHMAQTFSTVAIAFALAVVIGFLVGAAIHRLPRIRRAVDPLLASYYSIPFFVFYPLLIALFGLNTAPLIVIGFVFAMAAMVIATLNGLDRVPRVLLKTARIHRLGRIRSVLLVTLPAAAPISSPASSSPSPIPSSASSPASSSFRAAGSATRSRTPTRASTTGRCTPSCSSSF